MFKKIGSISMVIVLLVLIFGIKSFSAQLEKTTYNEYDLYLQMKDISKHNSSESKLIEANKFITAFETSLKERAAMEKEELVALGYDNHEIEIFKKISTGEDPTPTEMRAITGTCTGHFFLWYCTTVDARFYYHWEWDHSPFIQLKDAVAVRWLAYDANGYNVDVTATETTSSIDYYNNGTKQFTRTGTEEVGLDFNIYNIQFPAKELYQTSTSITEYAYAKTGKVTIRVALENSVNNQISYLKIAGLYGHTTIGINFPSVSLSLPSSISIDFSGNLQIDHAADRKAVLYPGNNITYI